MQSVTAELVDESGPTIKELKMSKDVQFARGREGCHASLVTAKVVWKADLWELRTPNTKRFSVATAS